MAIEIVFFFLFGIIVGSFLNVCITRIPAEESIVSPGSRCPKCLTPIKPYDNVPVFAWLWLKGKCRNCGTAISPMYPLMELGTGLLFVLAKLEFGVTQLTVKWIFFTCLLLVLAVTDYRERMLPDLVNWPGFFVGLFFAASVPPRNTEFGDFIVRKAFGWGFTGWVGGVADGLLAAGLGSFLLWGLGKSYLVLRNEEGMGLGDVKMIAMIGVFLGVRGTFLTLLMGSLLGSVIGIAMAAGLYLGLWTDDLATRATRRGLGSQQKLSWAIARKYQLPMGTFLAIGALGTVYAGPIVVNYFPALKGMLV